MFRSGSRSSAGRILGHLPFEIFHAGFSRPLAADRRRDLHQANLAVFAVFPGTEICFLVNDTPHEIGIETIDAGLPGNQAS